VLAGIDAIVRARGNQPVALVSPRSQAYNGDSERGGFGIGSFLLGLLGLLGAATAGVASLTGLRR